MQTIRNNCLPEKLPKLYKYCSFSDYALNDILTGYLTATRIGEFNDLFDGTIRHFETQESRAQESENEWSELDTLAKSASYQLDDVHDDFIRGRRRSLKTESRAIFRILDNFNTYACCLSSINNSTLMWSHYAASNTGICIEYDFNLAKIKNTIKNAIFPIAYSKQPINISDLLQDKKEKIFKHSIDAALLCAAINKADIWNYEHEWRWIIMLPIQRYCELRRIPLSAPKPSAIILGYHILKNCFYYDRNNQNEINRAQKNMDNLIKLLSYVKDNNIYYILPFLSRRIWPFATQNRCHYFKTLCRIEIYCLPS